MSSVSLKIFTCNLEVLYYYFLENIKNNHHENNRLTVTPYGLISIFITFNVNFKHIGEIIIIIIIHVFQENNNKALQNRT
jgi:uncharacterized membrane protein